MEKNVFTLTSEETAFFSENGYLGPFKVYEPDEALNLSNVISKKGRIKTNAVYGTENLINYDRHLDIEELTSHIFRPEIVHRLQSLMGPDLFCWRGEFFIKYPGSSGTEWHQVETYKYSTGTAHLEPTELSSELPFQLTVWTTFTESTIKNGCMKIMPGSHNQWYFDESKNVTQGRNKLFKLPAGVDDTGFFGYNYADFKINPEWKPDESKAVALEMKPGEAIIFTAKCMHGSYPNISKGQVRLAFASRYIPTHVKVYPGIEKFIEHGSLFDLTNYGTVLVSGEDRYKHNRTRKTNLMGTPLPKPHAPDISINNQSCSNSG